MADPSRWVVICCPVAGKKQAKPTVDNVLVPKMKELGIMVEVRETEHKGHATELAKELASEDCGVIAVGGDGTIHEVMDGLLEAGTLDKVRLGILSQGTMNFYAHSGGLPDAKKLPGVIQANTFRSSSLMKIVSKDSEDKPAKGAQVWRGSILGSMFGIMKELVWANLRPSATAIPGTLTLTLDGSGEKVTLKDTFFWIVVCLRNPYNGCLGDAMSSMVAAFSAHYQVTSFEWTRDEGNIGVCLDGDPTDASQSITGELHRDAWNVVGASEYLDRMPAHITKVGTVTAAGQKWLDANPPPDGVYMTPPGTKPTKAPVDDA